MAKKTELIKWQGRKTKLTKPLVVALESIALDPMNTVLTDEELVHELNTHLPIQSQISYPTFRNWKSGNYIANDIEEETYSAFLSALKNVRIHQKKTHINAMLNDEGAGTWQRRAWLLERKFDDLNLTIKHDHTSDGSQIAQFNFIHPDSKSKEVDVDDVEILSDDED